jgi:hypothetical protein
VKLLGLYWVLPRIDKHGRWHWPIISPPEWRSYCSFKNLKYDRDWDDENPCIAIAFPEVKMFQALCYFDFSFSTRNMLLAVC